jgi:hypothetical protein
VKIFQVKNTLFLKRSISDIRLGPKKFSFEMTPDEIKIVLKFGALATILFLTAGYC